MKRECEGLPRRKPEGSIASGLFSAMLLSKAELASIGSVVVEATYLERQIEELLWHLAGMTPVTGANFTQNMQMKSRIEMLRVLGRHHFEAGSEGWADLEQLARDLDEVNIARNTVVHGHWFVDTSKEPRFDAWRRKTSMEREPARAEKRRVGKPPLMFSAAEIASVAERIGSVHQLLIVFLVAHVPEMLDDDASDET